MNPLKPAATLTLALLLSAFAACADRSNSQQEVDTAVPHASAKECKPSVHPFWAKFREAVLKEDWEAVAGMTEFPLMVVRPADAKGKPISRQEFAKLFPQFLNAVPVYGHPGVDPKPATMKALIKTVSALAKDACGDFENMLVFDHWEFYLRPEGWRLGYIAVPEFPESMKHIPLEP